MAGLIELLGDLSKTGFDSLIRASLQGGVFILLVWLLCGLLPRLPASVRCTLWWLASLKLLVAFVCIDPLPIPVLAPPEPLQTATVGEFSHSAGPTRMTLTERGPVAKTSSTSFEPVTLTVGAWAAIVLLLLARLAVRMGKLKRIGSRAVDAPENLQELTTQLSESLQLSRPPALRFSEEVDTPLVLGFRKPIVLVPAGPFATLPIEEQRMALCHELVHLQRGDLWLAQIPALAERLFFFHPLVHLAVREYQLTREAACDVAVIQTLGAQPRAYGRLLLTLGVSRLPIHSAAAGSSSYSKLKRRITMLRDISNYSPRLRTTGWVAIFLAALAITPLTLVSRSQDREAPARPVPSVPAVETVSLPVAAAAVAAPAAPSQAVSPAKERGRQESRERQRDLNYVLFLGDNRMMSGSSDDISRAESFRKGDEHLLWFRRDGGEYIVRDPALLQDVEKIYRPLQQIGGDQAKLGSKQAEIGRRQAEIGRQQAEIGQKQAELGARQAKIGARQAASASRHAGNEKAEKDELESEHRELEQEMKQFESEMHELSAQMDTFNSPMNDLGKEMNGLSQEMNELSRKMQEASAKAEAEMSSLLDRAISSGKATEVK